MCFRELDKNRKVKVKLEHHMHILWVQFHPAACLFLTLSALSPPSLFSSPLFPHSYSFPPVIPPLFSSFYFFYFFFLPLSSSHSFRQHLFLERDERRMESIEADIRGSYISLVQPDQLLLFVVFYLRCTLWSISGDVGMTRLLGRYPRSIPRVIFFYSTLVLVSRMDGKEEWL